MRFMPGFSLSKNESRLCNVTWSSREHKGHYKIFCLNIRSKINCHFYYIYKFEHHGIYLKRVCVLSCFSHVRLFAILWTIARILCPWGLPWPSPVGLPDSGIEPESLMSSALTGGFLITSATWEALVLGQAIIIETCKTKADKVIKMVNIYVDLLKAWILVVFFSWSEYTVYI